MRRLGTWAVEDVDSGILAVAVEVAGDQSLKELAKFLVFSQTGTRHSLQSRHIMHS